MNNLTKNFSIEEFECSNKAEQLGINNKVPQSLMDNVQHLANHLQIIRDALDKPIIISSGYRCEALNAAVGGVKNSTHAQGLAADLVVQGMTSRELAEFILLIKIDFDQLILESAGGKEWVHFGIAPKNRQEVLTYSQGKYTQGLQA